jgi:glutamate racemase
VATGTLFGLHIFSDTGKDSQIIRCLIGGLDLKNRLPIGVCDSGVGGTSVVKQLMKVLPHEQIIYFGDTARVPYGPRPVSEILQFMEEIMEFFQERQVKLVVIACGTMTSQALEIVKHKFSFPMVGVSAGARSALEATRNKKIGVLATQGAISSGFHGKRISVLEPTATVLAQACPRWVPLVEAGQLDGDEVRRVSATYLAPLQEAGVDTLILGCTHYPYLRNVIADIMGPGVALIDPAMETAEEAKSVLERLSMLNQQRSTPYNQFFFSENPTEMQHLVEKIMDSELPAFKLADFGKVC